MNKTNVQNVDLFNGHFKDLPTLINNLLFLCQYQVKVSESIDFSFRQKQVFDLQNIRFLFE